PAIWLNVRGRDDHGTVAVADYQSLCVELSERLLAWRDPINGGRVVRRVWQRDALYSGPDVPVAPRPVFGLGTPPGYSYVGLPSYGEAGAPIEVMQAAALRGGKLCGMSGSHRADGLFMLAGDGIMPGRIEGVQIADMAASIIALCGLPVPAE